MMQIWNQGGIWFVGYPPEPNYHSGSFASAPNLRNAIDKAIESQLSPYY